MQLSDFNYDLPAELIAQEPLEKRTSSRLLVLNRNTGEIQDKVFSDFLHLITPNDLLVFNDTRVFPARLYGRKRTGGKAELLIERVLDANTVLAHVKANKTPKVDSELLFDNEAIARVIGREDDLFKLAFSGIDSLYEYLEKFGHIPLPPYIQREDQESDHERYQTVFAANTGAVAAPTAGLHFDEQLLQQLTEKGIQTAQVTLHVGAGTFQPVRTDNIDEHIMHKEFVNVSQQTVDAINACKQRGGRVFAVGTTTVRSLESAAFDGNLKPFSGDTRLFIKPGYEFNAIDVMLTNFHLPESTLLMLVAAFAGYENYQKAYHHAITHAYRFFSYGDAMLVL